MQVYTFKAYLAENPPICRKLKLLENQNLKDLHHVLIKAFHMVRVSKVGMYAATDKWRKKENYALAKLPSDTETILMEDTNVKDFIDNGRKQLIYNCTTNRNWTFNIELEKVKEKEKVKASKYPDWKDPSGHHLNDYNRKLAMNDDDDDEGFIDDENLGEVLKDFENPEGDD